MTTERRKAMKTRKGGSVVVEAKKPKKAAKPKDTTEKEKTDAN